MLHEENAVDRLEPPYRSTADRRVMMRNGSGVSSWLTENPPGRPDARTGVKEEDVSEETRMYGNPSLYQYSPFKAKHLSRAQAVASMLKRETNSALSC